MNAHISSKGVYFRPMALVNHLRFYDVININIVPIKLTESSEVLKSKEITLRSGRQHCTIRMYCKNTLLLSNLLRLLFDYLICIFARVLWNR